MSTSPVWKKCKKTGTCLWYSSFIGPSFPSPFFIPCPCVTTYLASVDSVIILVRISASTFGFMRDSFFCMVHALLTATSEYAKANHKLVLLDTGQMLTNIYVTILHLYRCCNCKPLSQLYIQQWHISPLKARLFGWRCSNCSTVQSSTTQQFSAGNDHCSQFKFYREF